MHRTTRRILSGLSAITVAAGLSVASTTPAEAYTRYYICNSGSSLDPIYLKNLGDGWSWYLYPGDCVNADNNNGDLRIDPDNELYGWPDVNRYRIGEINVGYRNWVSWDPDGTWVNPPDAWQYGNGLRMHTD